MSSLSRSRSLSCPSVSSFPADLIKTETSDQTSEPEVEHELHFHEHPLVLSTYLKVNENGHECNFCRFCKIYFTVGSSVYGCVRCNMFAHESCGNLPKWIDYPQHPQHELRLMMQATTSCAGYANNNNGIFTYRYKCEICSYSIDVKDAIQIIPISLFKNSYLNGGASSSLALYLKQNNNTAPKEEDFSIMVSSRKAADHQIHHFDHEHPLILSTYVAGEENDQCVLCQSTFTEEDVVTIIYRCSSNECRFAIHQSCAGLPKLVKSSLHPEHLLDYRPPTWQEFCCDRCNGSISFCPRYTCRPCDFDIHFKCVMDSNPPENSLLGKSRCVYLLPTRSTAPSFSRSLSFPMEGKRKSQIIFSEPPPNVPAGMSLTMSSFFHFQLASLENNVDTIRHISHSHPLVSLEFKIEHEYRYRCSCKFCMKRVLPGVTIYGCHECEFYLHEPCAELPLTVRNTLHPSHMLQLTNTEPEMGACQLCDGDMYFYCYGCIDCRIYFHLKCALRHNFEDHKEEEHTFHFIMASLFTCDACGFKEIEKERVSCLCTNCPFQVHKRCSNSFPNIVKQRRHHHKLKLTYFFEIDFDYANETCRICFIPINNVYCFYLCTGVNGCTYISHASCATSKYIVEDESTVNEAAGFVTTEAVVEGQVVEHFSHPHCLISSDEEPKNDAVCDACVSPISAPFYACATDDCNFYLHKQCFELPLEIQHPLHEHCLHLTSEEGFFRCYGCGFMCNGFSYSCTQGCWFDIDVRCSLLSDTLKHDDHECTLTLIYYYKYVRQHDDEDTPPVNRHKCSVCDGLSDSTCKFSCRKCNFHLDLGCASLPKSVMHDCPKHDWKPHPLQLTYGGIPDASGIYFCDMCEESRDISHWFYYCEDCIWSNHPKCVLGEFQFKYGKTYQTKVHAHELKLVKKPLSRHKVIYCDECKEPLMDDSPLFCAECNLYFHCKCVQWYPKV